MADHCYVTCPKTKLKVILHYVEEGWLGKSQNKVDGVIYRYGPSSDNKTKIKEVAEEDIVARLEGCWQDKVYYILPNSAVCSRQTHRDWTQLMVRRINISWWI